MLSRKLYNKGLESRYLNYKKEIEEEMTEFCQQMFAKFIPSSIIFRCITEGQNPGQQKNER